MEKAPSQLQRMISIKKAWHVFLESEGIDPATMDKVCKPFQHFVTTWLTDIAAAMGWEPNPEAVQQYKELLKGAVDQG